MLATRKGASREGWSEGSVVQSRDLTNRNRIGGRAGWTSVGRTAKSISIKTLCLSIRRVCGEGDGAYPGRSALLSRIWD